MPVAQITHTIIGCLIVCGHSANSADSGVLCTYPYMCACAWMPATPQVYIISHRSQIVGAKLTRSNTADPNRRTIRSSSALVIYSLRCLSFIVVYTHIGMAMEEFIGHYNIVLSLRNEMYIDGTMIVLHSISKINKTLMEWRAKMARRFWYYKLIRINSAMERFFFVSVDCDRKIFTFNIMYILLAILWAKRTLIVPYVNYDWNQCERASRLIRWYLNVSLNEMIITNHYSFIVCND